MWKSVGGKMAKASSRINGCCHICVCKDREGSRVTDV